MSIALDGGDLLDRVEARRRLDLDEHERLRVRLLDRRGDALGLPLVPHQQPEATPAERRESRRARDQLRLFDALHRGNHHAEGAKVEPAGDQVVSGVRHTQEGHRLSRSRSRQHVAHVIDPVAGVLEVEQRELRAGRGRQPGHRRRRELRHHRPEHDLAGVKATADRVVPHPSARSR